jgi:hypothetical protein
MAACTWTAEFGACCGLAGTTSDHNGPSRNRERFMKRMKTKKNIITRNLGLFTVIGLVSLLAGCATPKSRPSGESSLDSYPRNYMEVPVDLRPFLSE